MALNKEAESQIKVETVSVPSSETNDNPIAELESLLSEKTNEVENYPQIYLEQCKYKIKKRKMVDFIDAELDLISDD